MLPLTLPHTLPPALSLIRLHAAPTLALSCSYAAPYAASYPTLPCPCIAQVMNAQLAGAAAAIVYDDFYESLIIMSMPKGHVEPDIPSVFVTERSGFILTKLLEVEGSDLRVRIMPVSTCSA